MRCCLLPALPALGLWVNRGKRPQVSDRGVVLVDARGGDAPPRNPLFCPRGKVRFLELEAGQEPEAPE